MQHIAFDSHKHYTLARVETVDGKLVRQLRVAHEPGMLRGFLQGCEAGSTVAVETIGNWYWIVDEIEAAQMVPKLVHARKAKLMMGTVNKTDKLDARGLNLLQRTGTLPTVWIPPAEIRDKRDLARTRGVLVAQRTRLKNRIHSALARYGLSVREPSDLFGAGGRKVLEEQIGQLPAETRFATERLLEQLDHVVSQIESLEKRMREVLKTTPEMELLDTLPGVGFILAVTIALEVGDVNRFPSAAHLASYSGTVPRVHSSGGKTRFGQLRGDVNRYLKWAFVEAANVVSMNRRRRPARYVERLYERVAARRGHHKAIGAVARHLAEATYWMLLDREPYADPDGNKVASSRKA